MLAHSIRRGIALCALNVTSTHTRWGGATLVGTSRGLPSHLLPYMGILLCYLCIDIPRCGSMLTTFQDYVSISYVRPALVALRGLSVVLYHCYS